MIFFSVPLHNPYVLVCLRCCNKNTIDCVFLNSIFSLNALEAGEGKIKAPADSVSGKGPFPGAEMSAFLLCPHIRKGGKGALWRVFVVLFCCFV